MTSLSPADSVTPQIPFNGVDPVRAASISARIDRLPAVATIWRLIALLSIGGFFELYDLFQTAYISPGLLRDGIFATGAQGVFGFSDQAAFASATFLGLFLGASLLSPIADRFGRRAIFTFALIWYTVATVLMGVQSSALGIIGMRFLVGIGAGAQAHPQFGICLRVFHPVPFGSGRGADVLVAGAASAVRDFRLALGGAG
jgi:putative MFS transporter